MFNYSPLWKTMKEKEFSTYRLLKEGIVVQLSRQKSKHFIMN